MDIEDNADVLRLRQSLDLVLAGLRGLLLVFAETDRDLGGYAADGLHPPAAGRAVHAGLPAGAVRPGFARGLAGAAARLRTGLRGKGFKGAVGTAAAYAELIGVENLAAFRAAPV